MADLEQAWKEFEVECRRALGIDFGPADLSPLNAHVDISIRVRELWSGSYPQRPVPLDCLLFPRPSEFPKLIESQFERDWPRAYLPLSHVRDGHFSYQLVSERVYLVTNEEHWEPADAMPKADCPSFVAFIEAATNTLRLAGTSFFEVRTTKRWLRSTQEKWLGDKTCRVLAQTWKHEGYSPLLLGSTIDGTPLEELAVPKPFRRLMHSKDY